MAPGQKPATEWHMAYELLETGQYERIAEFLQMAQATSGQADDAILADILAVARRVCLALIACHTEVVWHKWAYKDASQRELELKQQLQVMLDMISGHETSETLGRQAVIPTLPTAQLNLPILHGTPKHLKRHSLWQHIQNLLGLGRSSRSPDLEAPAGSVEALVVSSVEKIEVPAATLADKVATQTLSSVEKEAKFSVSLPAEKEKEPRRVPSLVIYCLGPFRVYQNDQLIVEWHSLKGQAILKYLVMNKGRPVAKDILMDVFWPDVDPSDTRRNLHQAIYGLRQTLRHIQPALQPIQFKENCYLLDPEMSTWLDFEEFEEHVQAGRRLKAAGQPAEAMAEYSIAEGLYQGDFLEEDLYEDWPSLQREYLRNLYLDIADCLSKYYLKEGEYTATIVLCQKILAKDNCREETYRQLMECYTAQGQRHLAARQYQTCMQSLREELDLPPSEATVALYQRITTGV